MGMSSRVDAYQRRHRWAGHWSRSRAGRRHRGRPPSPSRAWRKAWHRLLARRAVSAL